MDGYSTLLLCLRTIYSNMPQWNFRVQPVQFNRRKFSSAMKSSNVTFEDSPECPAIWGILSHLSMGIAEANVVNSHPACSWLGMDENLYRTRAGNIDYRIPPQLYRRFQKLGKRTISAFISRDCIRSSLVLRSISTYLVKRHHFHLETFTQSEQRL